MKTRVEGESLVIFVEGRIDSANSGQILREIGETLAQHPGLRPVLDADGLVYISSAGLRVLMQISRTLPDRLTVRNVRPEIYEVFDVTGFTTLLNVTRRPREISVDGCPVIGRGAIGTVYRIDPDTIVKVYNLPDSMPMIQNEQRLSRLAFLKGIPTAIPFDIVRVGEKYGTVFELVKADNYNALLVREPERSEEIIREYGELVRQVHRVLMAPGDVPDARLIYAGFADECAGLLGPDLTGRLKERILDMPVDLHAVHGDLHMKNVMRSDGEPMLIDMETLCTGNPVFEFAGMYNAYCAFMADDPGNAEEFFGISAALCSRVYQETLKRCVGEEDAGALREAGEKARLLGRLHFLQMIAVRGISKPELRDIRIRRSLEIIRDLTGRLGDLRIREQ